MYLLDDQTRFPPVELADENGLLALGGDLGIPRLLLAYRSGIFPWYNEGEPILWWSPDPRFVLFTDKLKVSKSMHTVLHNGKFTFTINGAFSQVVAHCKTIRRKEQQGTWISPEIQHAFAELHRLGYAHSAEAWVGNELAGGCYGIRMGNIFFGESMFSKVSNASKFAFIKYVHQLRKEQVKLIDCQVYTTHLESLGAEMIPRAKFVELIADIAS